MGPRKLGLASMLVEEAVILISLYALSLSRREGVDPGRRRQRRRDRRRRP